MVNQERLINRFIEYVKIDSETGCERAFAEKLLSELQALGLTAWMDDAGAKADSNGNNVYGYLEGNKDIEPLLLSGHMDTVQPGIGIEPVIEDGMISSAGDTILGGDDKSGINAIIEALHVIKENNLSHGPIDVVFTICEEGGMRGSKNLEYKKIKSKRAVVLDSSGEVGKIINQAPAQDKIAVKIHGKSAHAGVAPQEGISAIMVASDAISRMKLLRVDEETTANIGSIHGGAVTNIVCPELDILAEARSLNDVKLQQQSQHMIECFKFAAEAFGAKIEYDVENMYKAYRIDESDELIQLATGVFRNLELDAFITSTGGGSDANVFNVNGIKAINLGTGMKKAHTLDEHITVESLVDIARVALGLMLR